MTDAMPAEGTAPEPPEALQRALQAAPYDPALHRAMAAAIGAGDELAAQVHLATAQLIEGYLDGTRPDAATDLCNVATAYFARGNYPTAELWYRIVLALDPEVAVAHMNLVSIYSAMGRKEAAERCRERAYRLQHVFVEREGDPALRVLVLCSGRTAGNVPVEVLLPTGVFERISYIIDYADAGEDERLPGFDFVFNAIGEPDAAAGLLARLQAFAARCPRPLLNAPAAVARTRRHDLVSLLAGMADVAVAPCLRVDARPADPALLAREVAAAGIGFPLLLRPAGSHGGDRLLRCDTAADLEQAASRIAGPAYATRFVDFRSGDGYYRKYRMVYVDGEPLPYHLAISPNWLVHYATSGTADDAARIDEERRFLRDPAAALGSRAMAAIAEIGRRIGLDYFGVDFTLLPDGRVLVFEANATMLVHYEAERGALTHKNAHVGAIADAFRRMAEKRRQA